MEEFDKPEIGIVFWVNMERLLKFLYKFKPLFKPWIKTHLNTPTARNE